MLQAQLSLISGKEGLGFITCQMDQDKDTVVELAGKTDCLLGKDGGRTCSVILFYNAKIESIHTDIYLFVHN